MGEIADDMEDNMLMLQAEGYVLGEDAIELFGDDYPQTAHIRTRAPLDRCRHCGQDMWGAHVCPANFGLPRIPTDGESSPPAHDGDEQKREHVREIYTK